MRPLEPAPQQGAVGPDPGPEPPARPASEPPRSPQPPAPGLTLAEQLEPPLALPVGGIVGGELVEVWVPSELLPQLNLAALLFELRQQRADEPILCYGGRLVGRLLPLSPPGEPGPVGAFPAGGTSPPRLQLRLSWRSWTSLLDELLRRLEVAAAGQQLVEDAAQLAASAHLRQVRRDGMPYILHPLEVANELATAWSELPPEVVAAALLHDVVEDGHATLAELLARFGPRVAGLVDLVSVKESHGPRGPQRDAAYLGGVIGEPDAARIKCADMICNTGSLHLLADDRQRRRLTGKYAPQVEGWLLPWARRVQARRCVERFDGWLGSPLTLLDLHHARRRG